MQYNRISYRILGNLNDIILHNAENIRGSTIQNIERTFSQSSDEYKEDITQILKATEGVMNAAYDLRTKQIELSAITLQVLNASIRLVDDRVRLYRGNEA